MKNLQSFFPVSRFGAIKTFTPITAGLSGAGVYAVATAAGEFVLRLHAAGLGGFGRMVAAQRLAADRSIAPEIVFVDEGAGAVVSAKAKGMPLGMALAQPTVRPHVLRSVAETLARLHAIPAPDFPSLDPSLGQSIWDEQSRREGFPSWAKPLGEHLASGYAVLAKDDRRAFGHNDANPSNFLWDGSQVWIVDWEHAALAHPYMDLATFSNFVNLSDDDAVSLLAIQEGARVTSEQRTLFSAMRNFSRVIYGAIFLRLIPDLAEIDFLARDETLTLPECYARLVRGGLDLKTATGQALLGAAIFRQVPI